MNLLKFIEQDYAETNRSQSQTLNCRNCGKTIRKADLEYNGEFVHNYSRFECPFCGEIKNVPVTWLKNNIN